MVRTGEDWGRPCFLHTTGTKRECRGEEPGTPLTAAVLPQQGRGTGPQPSRVTVPATERASRTGQQSKLSNVHATRFANVIFLVGILGSLVSTGGLCTTL